MMAAPKPSPDPPGSIAMHLPAFKRKRIEQWCEDVAQYLKAGSLCRSVIGHVMDDNRLSTATAMKSAPAGSYQSTSHHFTATSTTTATTTTTTTTTSAVTTTSMGTVTEMLSLHRKKEIDSHAKHGYALTETKTDTVPPQGRVTPMPDTSGPLPVVKFSYSHYNEQRRRVDRLVQGLPVLSASATTNSAMERLGGAGGALIYIGGEEPVKSGVLGTVGSKADRAGRTAGRASPAPGPAQRSNSRSSSGEPWQRSLYVSRHQSTSPSPTRNHPHPAASSQPHRGHQSSNKMMSSEIVVIEDDFHGQKQHNDTIMTPGLRSVKLNGLKRSQSQKVHKARQRMLAGTRRSNDQNNHTHVPVQSCWALAELTW